MKDLSSGSRHLRPHVEGTLPEYPVVGRPESVSAESEKVLNHTVDMEESLSLISRLEPPHLALFSSRLLMRHLGPVVGISPRVVRDQGHDRSKCRTIASELVSHEPEWFAPLAH